MKKVVWIVMKGNMEVSRCRIKRMAVLIASEVGGYVHKYTVEQ